MHNSENLLAAPSCAPAQAVQSGSGPAHWWQIGNTTPLLDPWAPPRPNFLARLAPCWPRPSIRLVAESMPSHVLQTNLLHPRSQLGPLATMRRAGAPSAARGRPLGPGGGVPSAHKPRTSAFFLSTIFSLLSSSSFFLRFFLAADSDRNRPRAAGAGGGPASCLRASLGRPNPRHGRPGCL